MRPRYRQLILTLSVALFCTTTQAGFELLEVKEKIDGILHPLVDEKKIVGIAIGIIHGGNQAVYGFGTVNLEVNRPPDGDTVFEIGSITKTFTGTLLAKMAEDGTLKLTDPVQMYLPNSVAVPKYEAREVTLLDLTTQTSGIQRMPGNFKPQDPENPYADYSVDQLYEFISKTKLKSEPGAKYLYSNAGVGLLGHALALKAGLNYESLVISKICEPLEMKDTRMTLTPEMRSRLAQPYSKYGKPSQNWDIPTLAGAGALRSTVNDMMKFMGANLGVIPSDLFSAMQAAHAPRFEISKQMSIGMGWHLLRKSESDPVIVWHNGETGGYRTFIGLLKESKVGVVILTNSKENVDDAGMKILLLLR